MVVAPPIVLTSRLMACILSVIPAWQMPTHNQPPAASRYQVQPRSSSMKRVRSHADAGGSEILRMPGVRCSSCSGAVFAINDQAAIDAACSRTLYSHAPGSHPVMLCKRSLTDNSVPSSLISVSVSPGKEASSRPIAVSAASGKYARPDVSLGVETTCAIRAVPSLADSPNTARLRDTGGAGRTLNVSSVITDSVPQEPVTSLLMSYPLTFFMTLPPDFQVSPRPLIALTPRIWSRALPALNRRGPARLPMKLPPTVPSSSTWYILFKAGGSKARCWLCFDNSSRISVIGVPGRAVMTSSSG